MLQSPQPPVCVDLFTDLANTGTWDGKSDNNTIRHFVKNDYAVFLCAHICCAKSQLLNSKTAHFFMNESPSSYPPAVFSN